MAPHLRRLLLVTTLAAATALLRPTARYMGATGARSVSLHTATAAYRLAARPRCRDLVLEQSASADGRSSPKLTVLQLTAAGGAGGALLAGVSRLLGGPAALLPLLSVVLFVYPVVAAVRLYRNGKRRAAFRLALSILLRRFCTRWWQYATIPLFAGAVGWLTNKV
jgi:hypothetical protein